MVKKTPFFFTTVKIYNLIQIFLAKPPEIEIDLDINLPPSDQDLLGKQPREGNPESGAILECYSMPRSHIENEFA